MATTAMAPRSGSRSLEAFRQLLEIIRDYGMPTVAFGAGIYAFFVVLRLPMPSEFKTAIALAMTLLGVVTQLWLYARNNPRHYNQDINDHLKRMTDILERVISNELLNK